MTMKLVLGGRVKPENHKRFNDLCEKHDRTPSWLLDKAVEFFLTKGGPDAVFAKRKATSQASGSR